MISETKTQTLDWVPEFQLPVWGGLKPVNASHPDYGLHEDDIRDRNEFIRVYFQSEYAPILLIPNAEENDFFSLDLMDDGAFGTHDFQKLLNPFDKYRFAMKKIMERIRDLAILYSVVQSSEDKAEIHKRYQRVLDNEFRNRLTCLEHKYGSAYAIGSENRMNELKYRIREGERTWAQNTASGAE